MTPEIKSIMFKYNGTNCYCTSHDLTMLGNAIFLRDNVYEPCMIKNSWTSFNGGSSELRIRMKTVADDRSIDFDIVTKNDKPTAVRFNGQMCEVVSWK